ncbi:response regulator [Dasania sp. GY-MA-18]|uniref:Response regulator n=1 Tax=Dasania phycosphaerae TaxID=2950436 RepID=A0A9J6RMM7_9GAMM|nr:MULTISPECIES: response regulator [Dasania]MCR8923009.1 response regulator [Dasania sp. GY-MA-18]MCZ0865440.1 response regulator [Dasania phycosphaerae]MCZ0869165.1 response regulator [Dasania phycosphaerae]
MQLLLVEDDHLLAKGLQQALAKQGHAVNAVSTGEAALHVVNTEPPDIVILDLGLPDMDGIAVLKRLRKKKADLPVLILTARNELDDKIYGLDCGADDYLAKPFDVAELFARLRVLERRLATHKSSEITIGDVSLDIQKNTVSFQSADIELSRREYMLLKSLMENAGRIQTRDTLEARLYSWGEEVSSNALEVHIHHLRKKLGADFIKTVRGVGYKVNLP